MIRFKVREDTVRMTVTSPTVGFQVEKATVVRTGGVPYEGPYEVTPKAYEQQTLKTKGMSMKEDVLVLAVPYYETDNEKGTTIYIASEV